MLKSIIDVSPYVVDVLEGSVAALSHESAMAEDERGTDLLVTRLAQDRREGTAFSQLKREGLATTILRLSLANAKKDELHVTTEEAVHFFNSYEISGVDINKVSTGGNSRGFYRVEALKAIIKGLGLRVESPTKGAYVEAIHTWHTQNQEAIRRDREKSRVKVTLEEELDDGATQ